MKYTAPILLLISLNAFADQSLHVTYQMEIRADKDTVMQGTSDYYFKSGDVRAEVDMQGTPLNKTVFLEIGEKKYTLFPQDKTYMEVSNFSQQYGKRQEKMLKSSPYRATGKKKTIAGYTCEVYVKESSVQRDTACLSKELSQKYPFVKEDIKKLNNPMEDLDGIPLEIISEGKDMNTNFTSLTVTKINQDVSGVTFEIPKDYKQQEAIEPDAYKDMIHSLKDAEGAKPTKEDMEKLQKMAEEMKKKYGKQ